MKKILIILFSIILLIVFVKTVSNAFLPEPKIIHAIPSPNGEYIAYVYESNGGATTGFVYHLSILKSDDSLKKKNGNTYISEYEFQVQWVDDDELYVNNTSSIKIGKQKQKIGDIRIEYKYMRD